MILRNHDIKITMVFGAHKDRVPWPGTADLHTEGLGLCYGRGDDVHVFRTEETGFAGVGIEARDRYSGPGNTELFTGLLGQ